MSNSTSLLSAARQGNETLLQEQLKSGVNPETEKDSKGSTAMHLAAEHNHVAAIELLHQKGAKLNPVNNHGWTPLMEASFKGHSKSIEILVHLGATVDSVNEDGYTAKALTMFRGYKECSELIPRDSYTHEFVKRKVLAHFNGIGGRSWIRNHPFSLSGAYSPLMHEYVATDLKSFCESQPTILSNQNKKKLFHAFRAASKVKTADEWSGMIKAGNLVILPVGWYRHAIDLVFYQNHMAICNRGEGVPSGSKTIDAYVIDRSKIDAELIQKILDQKSENVAKASEFFYEQLPKLLNAEGKRKKDSLCTKADSISPKTIKRGICTAGAAKASLRFSTWVLKAYSFNRVPPDDFEKKVVRFVKDWSLHCRTERIYEYCFSHFRHPEENAVPPDLPLIRDSLRKLGDGIYKQRATSSLFFLFRARLFGIKMTFEHQIYKRF